MKPSAAAYMLVGVIISSGIWFLLMSMTSSNNSEISKSNVSAKMASAASFPNPRQEIVETAKRIRQLHDLKQIHHGINPAEGSCLLALLKLTKCEVIVESGIDQGGSTRMFADFFDGKIISIDDNGYGDFQKTIDSFANNSNVKFRIGDGRKIVPKIIKRLKGRFAVMIDGPKCLLALPTIKSALDSGAQFVALHDACGCVQNNPKALGATLLVDPKDKNMTRILNPNSAVGDCYSPGAPRKASGAGGGTAIWINLNTISRARFR